MSEKNFGSINIKPTSDRVVISVQNEEMTSSGILLPNNQEKPEVGVVVAVGPGKKCDNGNFCSMQVKAGDRVLFGKYAGQKIKLDKEEYLIVKEEEILAII